MWLFKKVQSHSRNQLENWLKTLDITVDSVADVGGRKLPVKERVNSWKVKIYDILDLPDFDLNLEWETPKEHYDIVFCLEVFEYIYNPFQAMNNLFAILKWEGILYCSFHFIYPHHTPMKRDFLRYTRWGVEKLLKEAGFSSWEIVPRLFDNPRTIKQVYSEEKMKGLDYNKGSIHEEQGYLVTARKQLLNAAS